MGELMKNNVFVTVCPLCHKNEITRVVDLKKYILGRCKNCSCYINLSFNESKIQEVFGDTYYNNVQEAAFAVAKTGGSDSSSTIYEKGLDEVEKILARKGTLLDVGAAYGSFVKIAQGKGWIASGIEISEYSSTFAREQLGIPVETGTVVDLVNSQTTFDVITLWDVIEHVYDLKETLESIHSLLNKNGLLLITTDNFDSLITDIGFTLKSTIGWNWPLRRFLIPQNSVFLTPSTLFLASEKIGYSLQLIQGIDYPIDKINLTFPQKLLLRLLYGMGNKVNRQSQFMCILRKEN
jgi:2-polyprenyl-3-methyl-5-hydroxy-6-metoxy-1,4-benzoquinol methylase